MTKISDIRFYFENREISIDEASELEASGQVKIGRTGSTDVPKEFQVARKTRNAPWAEMIPGKSDRYLQAERVGRIRNGKIHVKILA